MLSVQEYKSPLMFINVYDPYPHENNVAINIDGFLS